MNIIFVLVIIYANGVSIDYEHFKTADDCMRKVHSLADQARRNGATVYCKAAPSNGRVLY